MSIEKIKPRVVDATGNYTFNDVTATGNLVSLNANLGNIATANYIKTDNLQYANGVSWPIGGAVTASGSNTQVQFNNAGSLGSSANFVFDRSTNRLTVDNITANGAALTNLTGANVSGTVGNANYAAYAGNITIAAQSNITSLGTLSSLTVTGNISSGNANLGNLVIANYFSGSGNNLSNIQGSNVSGQVSYAATANAVAGANVSGQVTYAATANAVAGGNVMGAVGLATYATTANAVAGANVSGAVAYATTANSVAGANVTGAVAYATTANAVAGANVSGAVAYATTANSVAGSNVSGAVGLATYATTANAVAGANVSGAVAYATTANAVAGANVSGQVANALIAGTVYTNAQSNITSVGTLTGLTVGNATANTIFGNGTITATGDISGANLTLSGNLTVSGTTTTVNSTTTRVVDPMIELGGGANGAALATNDSKDRGTLLHYYTTTPVDAFMGWKSANSEFTFASNATVTSDVATINSLANVRANYFIGNGSALTGITAVTAVSLINGNSNVVVSPNSNVTVSVTSVANVVTITSTGVNIAGYANLGSGNLTTIGNVNANVYFGNGSQLTGISAVSAGYIANGTSNINISTVSGNVTMGVGGTANVFTATTTGVNITGTLTTTANISAGSNYFLGNGYYLTGVDAAGRVVNGTSNLSIATTNGNITVGVNGTSNVVVVANTSVNVAGTLTTTGNISVGSNYFVGNGYYLTGLDAAGQVANGTSNIRIPTAGANITFTVNGVTAANLTSTGFVLLGTGNITAGNIYANAGTIGAAAFVGTLSTANQYNITNVGTLGNLSVTSNITSGNVYANSGIVKGQYIYGDGSNLTGLGGAGYIFNGSSNVFIATANGNVSFTVGGFTNIMTVTTTGANISGYANVTGNLAVVGNITSGNANLGNAVTANYFIGNFYGSANTASTVTTASQPNITSVGTLTSLTVSGVANLGSVGNLYIGGGAANYFLKTDGSGNLSWAVPAGGGGGGGTSLTYTADTSPPASGNILGDQWLNTSSNVLYEYISDGSASYWVDISSPSITTSASVGSSLLIKDEGSNLTAAATSINFVGAGVTATNIGSNVTVTVPSPAITIQEEGSTLTTTATSINFVGSTVLATNVGNAVTVTVSAASGETFSPFMLMGA